MLDGCTADRGGMAPLGRLSTTPIVSVELAPADLHYNQAHDQGGTCPADKPRGNEEGGPGSVLPRSVPTVPPNGTPIKRIGQQEWRSEQGRPAVTCRLDSGQPKRTDTRVPSNQDEAGFYGSWKEAGKKLNHDLIRACTRTGHGARLSHRAGRPDSEYQISQLLEQVSHGERWAPEPTTTQSVPMEISTWNSAIRTLQ